jgi:hypothetical protein
MRDDERRKLARLLSGGPGLAGPEVREVEQRLLATPAELAASVAPRRTWLWAPLAGLASAAAALMLMLLLAEPGEEAGQRLPEFTARGQGQPRAALSVTCLRAGGGPLPEADRTCRRGDLLSIKVVPRRDERFLSAASLGPGDELVWYFPGEGIGSLPLAPSGLASRGALVGEGHAAGRHRLFVVLSPGPLGRDAVRAALEAHLGGEGGAPRVLETSFEVGP